MKYIYLHDFDGYSQRWYKTESDAFKACVRKNKYMMSFGIPQFVNTSNKHLIEHIKDKINLALLAKDKPENLKTGYDIEAIKLVSELKELL